MKLSSICSHCDKALFVRKKNEKCIAYINNIGYNRIVSEKAKLVKASCAKPGIYRRNSESCKDYGRPAAS